jgi:hypothetical protein
VTRMRWPFINWAWYMVFAFGLGKRKGARALDQSSYDNRFSGGLKPGRMGQPRQKPKLTWVLIICKQLPV